MYVLMLSAEAAPFAKTGGLADAVWALSRALRARGFEVGCMLPRYRGIDVTQPTVVFESSLDCFTREPYRVLRTRYQDIDVFLVESRLFSKRRGIYGDSSGNYVDNALRFSILGDAASTYVQSVGELGDKSDYRGKAPTVVHGHDWPAGPGLSLCAKLRSPESTRTPTVFTIHNAAYEGTFALHDIHYTGLRLGSFTANLSESRRDGEISFLSAGIRSADETATVSPAYASELAENRGVKSALDRAENRIIGILNGVDYGVWDPAIDRLLPARYSPGDLAGKWKCKRRLADAFGFQAEARIPIIGMVSRLVDQKGFEELCFPDGGALARIARLDVRVVILGTGDPRYENGLKQLAKRCPRLSVRISFDESAAHLIEAGSDLYLMPSRFEPCGLNQLYSLRYGTPPIVHSVGGLSDTIFDLHDDPIRGNGYRYAVQTQDEIVRAVSRGVDVFRRQPALHRKLMLQGMAEDHGWEKSAAAYAAVYRRASSAARSTR